MQSHILEGWGLTLVNSCPLQILFKLLSVIHSLDSQIYMRITLKFKERTSQMKNLNYLLLTNQKRELLPQPLQDFKQIYQQKIYHTCPNIRQIFSKKYPLEGLTLQMSHHNVVYSTLSTINNLDRMLFVETYDQPQITLSYANTRCWQNLNLWLNDLFQVISKLTIKAFLPTERKAFYSNTRSHPDPRMYTIQNV